MSNEMVALQGKAFSVDLQSMLGSTLYGWSLTGIPQGIALLGTETSRTTLGVAPVIQRFWFGAYSAVKDKASLEFTLVNVSDVSATEKKHTVSVKVIPSDSEEFAKLSENSDAMVSDVCNSMQPYGYPLGATNFVNMAYGYPYRRGEVVFKYGYPCATDDVNVKYGYPCGTNDVNLKYGYPCDDQVVAHKYGYPCGVQDVLLKYGFPCKTQDVNFKYGYPCGVQDVLLKYGFPGATEDVNFKYGYPCGAQDAALKYGFPCKSSDAAIMYGYKCDSSKSDC